MTQYQQRFFSNQLNSSVDGAGQMFENHSSRREDPLELGTGKTSHRRASFGVTQLPHQLPQQHPQSSVFDEQTQFQRPYENKFSLSSSLPSSPPRARQGASSVSYNNFVREQQQQQPPPATLTSTASISNNLSTSNNSGNQNRRLSASFFQANMAQAPPAYGGEQSVSFSQSGANGIGSSNPDINRLSSSSFIASGGSLPTTTPTTTSAWHAPSAAPSTGASKAVLSALKSLQDKIRKLESEKAFFQESFENMKKTSQQLQDELETRDRIEQQQKKDSMEQLAMTQKREEQYWQEKMEELKLKHALEMQQQEHRIEEMQKKHEQEKAHLERKVEELNAKLRGDEQHYQKKIEELERILTEERRIREKMDLAMKDIIRINSSLIEKVSVLEEQAMNNAAVATAAAEAAKKGTTRRSVSVTKKRSTTPTSSSAAGLSSSAVAKIKKKAATSSALNSTVSKTPLFTKVGSKTMSSSRGSEPNRILFYNRTSSSEPSDLGDQDVDQLISQIEEEYRVLNKQYHQLLTKAQDTVYEGSDYVLTETLTTLLDQMERKANQLKSLQKLKMQQQQGTNSNNNNTKSTILL